MVTSVAKGYHNLAGLCRDLRNAQRDASDGSREAAQLVDELCELLDVLDEGGVDELHRGEDEDGDARIDEPEDEGDPDGHLTPGTPVHERRVDSMGNRGQTAAEYRSRGARRQADRLQLQLKRVGKASRGAV